MALTRACLASKQSRAILVSKTTLLAGELRDVSCAAVALAVDSAMIARVKDNF